MCGSVAGPHADLPASPHAARPFNQLFIVAALAWATGWKAPS
jgi:hypothetical protein